MAGGEPAVDHHRAFVAGDDGAVALAATPDDDELERGDPSRTLDAHRLREVGTGPLVCGARGKDPLLGEREFGDVFRQVMHGSHCSPTQDIEPVPVMAHRPRRAPDGTPAPRRPRHNRKEFRPDNRLAGTMINAMGSSSG